MDVREGGYCRILTVLREDVLKLGVQIFQVRGRVYGRQPADGRSAVDDTRPESNCDECDRCEEIHFDDRDFRITASI